MERLAPVIRPGRWASSAATPATRCRRRPAPWRLRDRRSLVVSGHRDAWRRSTTHCRQLHPRRIDRLRNPDRHVAAADLLVVGGRDRRVPDTNILIANPNASPAPIDVAFIKDDGTTVARTMTLLPTSRTTIHVADIRRPRVCQLLDAGDDAGTLPLVIERNEDVGPDGLRSAQEKASIGPRMDVGTSPKGRRAISTPTSCWATRSGSTRRTSPTARRRDDGAARLLMLATSRLTLDAAATPEHAIARSVQRSRSNDPAMAERAMYFDTPTQLFGGGSASAGVTTPSTTWRRRKARPARSSTPSC